MKKIFKPIYIYVSIIVASISVITALVLTSNHTSDSYRLDINKIDQFKKRNEKYELNDQTTIDYYNSLGDVNDRNAFLTEKLLKFDKEE
jgi:uncharacterized protein YqkB